MLEILAILAGIAVCAALVPLARRNRALRAENARLGERVEELSDRNWELKDAEERSRSLLEAQGDVIVRRDADGRITYVNDAFCVLAGLPREALIATDFALPLLAMGEDVALPDGTRLHDQKIATADGARWIAWHDVMARAQAGERLEIQSVGRDITDRVEAERALAEARDQAEAASLAKSRFLAMV